MERDEWDETTRVDRIARIPVALTALSCGADEAELEAAISEALETLGEVEPNRIEERRAA